MNIRIPGRVNYAAVALEDRGMQTRPKWLYQVDRAGVPSKSIVLDKSRGC